MFPLALVIVAMFFTSIYFTFRDCFVADDDASSDAESLDGAVAADGRAAEDKP
jgi:hypothetical protein